MAPPLRARAAPRALTLEALFPDPIVVVAHAAPDGLLPPGASTWSPGSPPGTWAPASLPVAFVLGSPTARDVGAAAAGELDVALRTWTLPSCSGFRATSAGARATPTTDDGTNVVVIHDDAWPPELTPGAVAQTVVHLDAAGRIRDADVHLNAVEWRFSLDGASGTLDLRSVLVHEIGHALGLGHSADARATMATNGSGVRWRSLEADDVAGVCALYPGDGAPDCDEAPCPDGYACVARTCQRRGDRGDVCSPCDPAQAGTCEAAGDGARCVDPGLFEGATTGGSVCGRTCASDTDCGTGFACRPTTVAGDLQCISLDGCRNAASACKVDADCKDARCVGGACVGPSLTRPVVTPDAGAAPTPVDLDATGGGSCALGTAPGGGRALALVLVAFGLLAARRSRSR